MCWDRNVVPRCTGKKIHLNIQQYLQFQVKRRRRDFRIHFWDHAGIYIWRNWTWTPSFNPRLPNVAMLSQVTHSSLKSFCKLFLHTLTAVLSPCTYNSDWQNNFTSMRVNHRLMCFLDAFYWATGQISIRVVIIL